MKQAFHRQERQSFPSPSLRRASVGLMVSLAVLVMGVKGFSLLLNSKGFDPHGECYLWIPGLVALHVGSDTLIGLSYVAISATLLYFVYKVRSRVPFHWIFVAFGVFIVACGGTHFMEVWTVWHATYWLSGTVKLVTALASFTTAVVLPPLVPKAMTLLENARLSEQRKQQLEQAHEELRRLYAKSRELDQVKTEFFANISHELRTPLTLILGPTSSLLESGQFTDEQRQSLQIIERNAVMLLKQVNDLLDITKLEARRMELHYSVIDLAQTLQFCASHFDSMAQERDLAFEVESLPKLVAQVDEEKVQRIVLNLLSNAFKFTPKGGRICCRLYQQENMAVIEVQDSGSGVQPEHRQSIFERFRQVEGGDARRFQGTGLGLAIVKEFVELHHGTVKVDDAPGGGALFIVKLPLIASTPFPIETEPSEVASVEVQAVVDSTRSALHLKKEPDEDNLPEQEPVVGKTTILVIEDNDAMSRFIADVLSPRYRIIAANDGATGVEKACQHLPDLIICDLMMPRMSGEEVVKALRAHVSLNLVPVLLLSAMADDEVRIRLLRTGAQDYLVKPFLPEELRARVDNLVSMKLARQALQQELANQTFDITLLANEVVARKREVERMLAIVREEEQRKDQFMSMVSHELRTPLTVVSGFMELLRSSLEHEGNSRTMHYILQVESQIKKMISLINTLLDLSRIQLGRFSLVEESFEVDSFVHEVVEAMQTTTRHPITIDASTHATLVGDKERLGQVLSNLLSNAIKYSLQHTSIEVRASADEQQVTISVRDYGIGISPAHQQRIFDRFYRVFGEEDRHIPGLGIGLYLAAEIVHGHGGAILVQSVEGKGSTFSITLPRKKSAGLVSVGLHERKVGQ
ncbi:MAG TPA: ATP-binding protein [Ktedonobacteraceae bacterium]|jgi:signal transduction histidine kinase|nr:ATP-binding protein [Ktedonobacteraceae bacterium]